MSRDTLVGPRVAAAVGLLALGSGVGITLMLAQKFPLVGLVLSLAAVSGVIWIYSGHFNVVYRSLV